MSVTLMQLCEKVQQEYGISLIAGSKGADSIVRWAHILESAEKLPALRGGELIITTGAGCPDKEHLAAFVAALQEAGAAGAVLVLGSSFPEVPETVIAYCDKNGFPLFALPDGSGMLDLSYELCRRIAGSEKRESAINDALKAIIADPSALRSYNKMLTRASFSDSEPYTAITIYGADTSGESMVLRRIIKGTVFRSAMFAHKGLLTAVFQKASADEIGSFCSCAESAYGKQIHIGISGAVPGLAGIPAACEQSEAALVSSILTGAGCTRYSDIGILRLVVGVKDRDVLRSYVSEQLGTLTDYDREHGTDLARTLRIYLESNSSVNETAAKQKVHRNTVNSKIRTVRELLGKELDDACKSRLTIAFLISDVLRVYDEMLNTNEA